MEKVIYSSLRFVYFVGPFLNGMVIAAFTKQIASDRKNTDVLRKYIIAVIFLTLSILAAAITYIEYFGLKYSEVGIGICLIFSISLFAGMLAPIWWPYVKNYLNKPYELRYFKIFSFLFIGCSITNHIPYEISSFIILAIFSLIILGGWELVLWLRPHKKLLDDEI